MARVSRPPARGVKAAPFLDTPRSERHTARVRIIAGEFGGRVLQAPRGRGTRPTSDRVREALFSILGDIGELNANVLDLYAGSGALGFEALSRGAASATFVEEARGALASIRHNAEKLGVGARARILAGDVVRVMARLARERRRFGLVFVDPPYELHGIPGVLNALCESSLVLRGSWVVYEHSVRTIPIDEYDGLYRHFTRVYGDTGLSFYERTPTMEER
jgi:16S rRNA (guanine966-N2)-methyltransferase